MAGKYPTKKHIAEVFSHVAVGDYDTFFEYVVPDVCKYIFQYPPSKQLPMEYRPAHTGQQLHGPLEPPHSLYLLTQELTRQKAWTVQSKTILGGTYASRDDFRAKTFGRLGKIMDPAHPVRPVVRNIVGGGPDEPWAVVEMTNESRTKTGLDYNNTFAWATRWDTEGRIVEVRAYLDTALVRDIVEGTEGKV